MRIGRAARESNLSVKAIRHYEEEGLLGPISRQGSRRAFTAKDIDRLRLVSHCRAQGFGVAEIREIVSLLPAQGCPSAHAMAALDQMDLQFDQAWALIDNAAEGLEDDLGRHHPASVAADIIRRWIASLGGDLT